MGNSNIGIICHGDADGICAAAIVKSKFHGAEVFFSRPPYLHKAIRELEKYMKEIDHLYILDIAINPKYQEFVLDRLSKSIKNYKISYFDNHLLPKDLDHDTISSYVTEYNKIAFSSSAATTFVSLYGKTTEDIISNRRLALLGAYGSISDYSKNCDFLQKVMNIWDESSIYYQAYLLKQASRIIQSDKLKRIIVNKLSVGILPSEISEIDKAARETSREIDVAIPFIKKNAVKIADIGMIFECPIASMGHNAYVTATMTDSRVGIAIRKSGEFTHLVLRKRHHEMIDLGEIARVISVQFGCDGGGEVAAAGITCFHSQVDDVLQAINIEIEKY